MQPHLILIQNSLFLLPQSYLKTYSKTKLKCSLKSILSKKYTFTNTSGNNASTHLQKAFSPIPP